MISNSEREKDVRRPRIWIRDVILIRKDLDLILEMKRNFAVMALGTPLVEKNNFNPW